MRAKVEASFRQLRLGGREVGLRRAQHVLLDQRVEPGDDLAGLDHIADVDGPLDHPPVETKGEAGLVLGSNLAGQRDGLAFRPAFYGDRSHGPGLGSRSSRLVATRKGSGDEGGHGDPVFEHWRCLSKWLTA